jgi:hypothetical protein
MYALVRKSGHGVWKERWYALMSGISLWIDRYMTRKDQVYVADVVVINSTQKMMALNVIS